MTNDPVMWYCKAHRDELVAACGGDRRPALWVLHLVNEAVRDERFKDRYSKDGTTITMVDLNSALRDMGQVCCFLSEEALQRTIQNTTANVYPEQVAPDVGVQSPATNHS